MIRVILRFKNLKIHTIETYRAHFFKHNSKWIESWLLLALRRARTLESPTGLSAGIHPALCQTACYLLAFLCLLYCYSFVFTFSGVDTPFINSHKSITTSPNASG